jgi:hypothetical protein
MSHAVRHKYRRTLAGKYIMPAALPVLVAAAPDPHPSRYAAARPWPVPLGSLLLFSAHARPRRPHQSEAHRLLLAKRAAPHIKRLLLDPALFAKLRYGKSAALMLRNLLAPILASPRLFGSAVLHATLCGQSKPSGSPVHETLTKNGSILIFTPQCVFPRGCD